MPKDDHGPLRPLLPTTTKCASCAARRAGVCGAMAETELDQLSATAIATTVRPGQRFLAEGEVAHDFFTLTGGTVRLLKGLPDARQQITSFAGRGDFLGLTVGERHAYSAEAVDTVTLCRFPRPGFFRLLARFPALEHRLLSVIRFELVRAQEQMLLLGRKRAAERVASFLVARRHEADAPAGAPRRVSLPMKRVDMADYLGLTVETVSRTLTALKANGTIRVTPMGDVWILDMDGLEAIAAGIAAPPAARAAPRLAPA